MGEVLLRFQSAFVDPEGVRYECRACGGAMDEGGWAGWIEFEPFGGGPTLRAPRETTQPNRTDTEYWATGLTPVYLEGAFLRAAADTAASEVPGSEFQVLGSASEPRTKNPEPGT